MKSIKGERGTTSRGDRTGTDRGHGHGLDSGNGGWDGASHDSWVDAVVTLLATVVFGLGWALVELERAEPTPNRYAAVASEMWVAAVATSIQTRANDIGRPDRLQTDRRREQDARWTELALQNSNR